MIQNFVQTKQTIPIDDTDAFIMIFFPFTAWLDMSNCKLPRIFFSSHVNEVHIATFYSKFIHK